MELLDSDPPDLRRTHPEKCSSDILLKQWSGDSAFGPKCQNTRQISSFQKISKTTNMAANMAVNMLAIEGVIKAAHVGVTWLPT